MSQLLAELGMLNMPTKDQLIYVTCQDSVTEYIAEVDSLELDWLLEGT